VSPRFRLPSLLPRVVGLAGFQIAWFATAFAVAAERALWGTLVSGAVCAAHVIVRTDRVRLLALVAVTSGVGYAADTILGLSGALRFKGGALGGAASPLWMVLLWANLALTLDALPAWMTRRQSLAALAGAIGGPLSYLAGERFGALALGRPEAWSVAAVSLEWTLAMPLLIAIESRTRGRTRTASGLRERQRELGAAPPGGAGLEASTVEPRDTSGR